MFFFFNKKLKRRIIEADGIDFNLPPFDSGTFGGFNYRFRQLDRTKSDVIRAGTSSTEVKSTTPPFSPLPISLFLSLFRLCFSPLSLSLFFFFFSPLLCPRVGSFYKTLGGAYRGLDRVNRVS